MFHLDCTTDPGKFLSAYGPLLLQHAAAHNIILDLCRRGQKKAEGGDEPGTCFYVLSKNNAPLLAAMQTPPHNLLFSRLWGAEGMAYFADILAAADTVFPGVVGPPETTQAFAAAWTQRTGQRLGLDREDTIYVLKTLIPPPPVAGRGRLAGPEDIALLAEWLSAFTQEVLPEHEHVTVAVAAEGVLQRIEEKRLYVWEADGVPVSMAGAQPTPDMTRLGYVYTPPALRGKGYAAAVVAEASRRQMEAGKSCLLYADDGNATATALYRKLGYEAAARSLHYIVA